MAFRIQERFSVRAPPEAVWAYLIDPQRVVTCLPGAELTEVVDPRTFHGNVKVKVGPVTVAYKGRVHLTEVDEGSRMVKLVGEGREGAGTGSAKMTMESTVRDGADGETAVTVNADVDVVGRAVQLGRGMLEQVAAQLFRQFAACVRATLEAEAAARADTGRGAAAAMTPTAIAPASRPVRVIPLLFQAVAATVAAFFRKLFGRSPR